MAQIEDLEVQCEKDLFRVRIKFDRPFYGMVFSKGFYSNVNCVHVPAGLGQTQATFDIAMGQVSVGQCWSVGWLWLWFLPRQRVLVVLSAANCPGTAMIGNIRMTSLHSQPGLILLSHYSKTSSSFPPGFYPHV